MSTDPRDALNQLVNDSPATLDLASELQALQVTELPQDVGMYLLSLLNDAQIPEDKPELKKQMLLDLNDRLEAYLTTAVVEALPEDKVDEFMKLSESGDPAQAQEWITTHLPNAQDVFTQAFAEFREAYLHPESVE